MRNSCLLVGSQLIQAVYIGGIVCSRPSHHPADVYSSTSGIFHFIFNMMWVESIKWNKWILNVTRHRITNVTASCNTLCKCNIKLILKRKRWTKERTPTLNAMDNKGMYPSQSSSSWSLHKLRSHGYKLIVITIIFIISLQFSLQFTSYNNRLMGLNYFMMPQSMPFTDARRVNFSNLNTLNGRIIDASIYSDDVPVNGANTSNIINSSLPLCPLVPPKLVGRLKVLIDEVPDTLKQVEALLPYIREGGRYSPPHCKASHKVAIIIPYRDRPEHLRIFLHNIHPVLSRQNIDYGIFVIEEVSVFATTSSVVIIRWHSWQ